jgi:hypothetical protein
LTCIALTRNAKIKIANTRRLLGLERVLDFDVICVDIGDVDAELAGFTDELPRAELSNQLVASWNLFLPTENPNGPNHERQFQHGRDKISFARVNELNSFNPPTLDGFDKLIDLAID